MKEDAAVGESLKETALKLADDLDAMKLFGASGIIRRLVEELDKQEKQLDELAGEVMKLEGELRGYTGYGHN